MPQDILLGALTIVPVAGGKASKIGNDVPNLPGKVVYSKDGSHVACVAGFSVLHDIGELKVAKVATGETESLADGVTYFGFSERAIASRTSAAAICSSAPWLRGRRRRWRRTSRCSSSAPPGTGCS